MTVYFHRICLKTNLGVFNATLKSQLLHHRVQHINVSFLNSFHNCQGKHCSPKPGISALRWDHFSYKNRLLKLAKSLILNAVPPRPSSVAQLIHTSKRGFKVKMLEGILKKALKTNTSVFCIISVYKGSRLVS